jgi:hypothetical protein
MKMKVLLGIGVIIGAFGAAQAAVITSTTSGAWTNGATWGGSVPGSGDAAIVNHDVSLSSSASVGGYVNVGSTGGPGLLTLNNGAVLKSVSTAARSGPMPPGLTWLPDPPRPMVLEKGR